MKKSWVIFTILAAVLALGALTAAAIWSMSRINHKTLSGSFLEMSSGKVGVVEIKGLISESKVPL